MLSNSHCVADHDGFNIGICVHVGVDQSDGGIIGQVGIEGGFFGGVSGTFLVEVRNMPIRNIYDSVGLIS